MVRHGSGRVTCSSFGNCPSLRLLDRARRASRPHHLQFLRELPFIEACARVGATSPRTNLQFLRELPFIEAPGTSGR